MPNIRAIQSELKANKIDGWLFCDHHHRDPIANRVLGLGENGMATRRWFYFIPSRGEPRKLVHRIEAGMLDSLDGRKYSYAGWEELHKLLPKLLSGSKRIAMQYSPENNIPYIGLVDAGTVELIRKLKKKVVSSADLVQKFEASWSPEQLESHLEAGGIVDRIRQGAFEQAAASVTRRQTAHRIRIAAVDARPLSRQRAYDRRASHRRSATQQWQPALRTEAGRIATDSRRRFAAARHLGEIHATR